MREEWIRTGMLLGNTAIERLQKSSVAVFGVGGVGGYVAEALARCGIGTIELIDKDVVSRSNINRQIIALQTTIGRPKVEVMKERLLQINPEIKVTARQCFYLPERAGEFDFTSYDYVVDAVDTVTAKLSIIMRAKEAGVPVISSMGAGNKLDPSRFEVADISATSVCPLAKVMRRELKARGIQNVKVVFSKEPPCRPLTDAGETDCRAVPGSIAFVPAAAGLVLAGEVVRDITAMGKFIHRGKQT